MVPSKLVGTHEIGARDARQRFVGGGYPQPVARSDRDARRFARAPTRPPREHSSTAPPPVARHATAAETPSIPQLLDPELARAVTGLLDEHLGDHAVQVVARGDTITLRGRVHNPLARLLAEDLAFSFQGVERCCNFLTAGEPQAAAIGTTDVQ